MFGKGSKQKNVKIDSLIGQQTEIHGDIRYSGGLHIDGMVKGNVIMQGDDKSMLSVSEQGVVEGDVRVANIILNGKVIGNVYATERVELAPNARVTGNVYYNLIEMAMGSEVNGNLVHQSTPVVTNELPGKTTDKTDKADEVKNTSHIMLDQMTHK